MLPRIDLPKHKHKLKYTGKEIEYRPFTVGEQEILLKAKADFKETPNTKILVDATVQVLEQCTLNKVDIRKLPLFDVTMLFIKIRSKSVDDFVTFAYEHKYTDEEGIEKKDVVNVKVNLNDVTFKEYEDHTNVIKFDDTTGLSLKYPSFDLLDNVDVNDSTATIIACLDVLYVGDEVFDFSESTDKEKLEWYKDLPFSIKTKIEQFFKTMPTVYYKHTLNLRNGVKKELEYKTLSDFFS